MAASRSPPTAGVAGLEAPAGRGLSLHEWIALGALAALVACGVQSWAGLGAVPIPALVGIWPAWYPGRPPTIAQIPLVAMLVLGGVLLVGDLVAKVLAGTFGSDLLAGMAIVTSVLLGEWLAGVLVVLMLSGGAALESRAVSRAGNVLHALARRMPTLAHRRTALGLVDIPLAEVAIGDLLVVLPHEICPVDGVVEAGHGSMDESYLTGEPYRMAKAPGSGVLSGAINGQAALEVRTTRVAADSRYAKIMDVLRASADRRPRLQRLADSLGALYTPLALVIAAAAWFASGEATRFLAVLVVATPCPLLIAIPVAIIGAVSLAARHGIVIRDPAILERLDTCRIAIFDKTGTLTYGAPQVTEVVTLEGALQGEVLQVAASLEAYSKHPLALAVVEAATAAGITLLPVESLAEKPGHGLTGRVHPPGGRPAQDVMITSRGKLLATGATAADRLPAAAGGLECVVVIEGRTSGLIRFRDAPRRDGASFIGHLGPAHGLQRVMLVSGDRESEVRWLADHVGITEVHASVPPEGKLRFVEEAIRIAPTLFVGDGINDAPALAAATVGIAMGAASDVTSEAAGAVIMDSCLERVDELFHIGRRLRTVAMQSAVGGMAASLVGMGFAAAGWLSPPAGALVQEAIDVAAVLNALRVAWDTGPLSDYGAEGKSPSAAAAGPAAAVPPALD
ncbi:MAG: heavy metal translocating P-type ATPase [Planctomycetota bacterium]|nr:MAG: heavy metal translocating P-type ATPase [Planctomycetota bacterium]